MASLFKVKTKTGEAWRIQLTVNDDRRSVFFGKSNKKAAETIRSRVETIESCNAAGISYPPDVAQWLGTIGDDLHGKLSKVGLLPARQSRLLHNFLIDYKDEKSAELKPRTIAKFDTSIKSIVGFLGNIPLRDVSPEQAAKYRASLVKAKYSEATIAKMVSIARQFFDVAKKRKLIDDNPFSDVKTGSHVNKDRQYYVTQSETDHLINACCNTKQRLIIALGRYAGLRIPSELVGLRWSEVNWDNERFIVHSPKTEHHDGKDKRTVPIFGNLRPYLDEAWENAPEGEDRIFPEIHEKKSMGSWIAKLANRAGVALWEKPFQNMRSSCETDLIDSGTPNHVCEAWLGHTERIANKHYRPVTEDHFAKAAKLCAFSYQMSNCQRQDGSGINDTKPLLEGSRSRITVQ